MKTLLTLLASAALVTATTASARDFHRGGTVRHGYVGHYHRGVSVFPGIGIGVGPYYSAPYYGGYDADPGYYDEYPAYGYYGGGGYGLGYYGGRSFRGGSSRGHSSVHGHSSSHSSSHGSSHHH